MPIHPISETKRKGTLGSYYSISNYKEINPEFGNKDDFDKLINLKLIKMKCMSSWTGLQITPDGITIDKKTNPEFYTKNSKGEIIDPINPSISRTGDGQMLQI